MWIDEDVKSNPAAFAARKRGQPFICVDVTSRMLPGSQAGFRLPLRAPQGFAQSQWDLAFSGLCTPNRAQKLKVIPPAQHSGEPLHLVIDNTGLKLHDEKERK